MDWRADNRNNIYITRGPNGKSFTPISQPFLPEAEELASYCSINPTKMPKLFGLLVAQNKAIGTCWHNHVEFQVDEATHRFEVSAPAYPGQYLLDAKTGQECGYVDDTSTVRTLAQRKKKFSERIICLIMLENLLCYDASRNSLLIN